MKSFVSFLIAITLSCPLTRAQNCIPGYLIKQSWSTLTLSSVSLTGNQWYLNDTLINGATNEVFPITKDGEYKLRISSNGCDSYDSIQFKGIFHSNSGEMSVPEIPGATISWYDSKDSLIGRGTRFRATINGTYKVVINSTTTFYHTFTNIQSPCFAIGCEGLAGFQPVFTKPVNYPKRVEGKSDLTYDMEATIPSCFFAGYTGRVIVVANANTSLKYFDTVYTTLYAGKTNIISGLNIPASILDGGLQYSDSIVSMIFLKLQDDGECGDNSMSPGPYPVIVYRVNCLPAPLFYQTDLTLSSIREMGNKWYVNDTLVSHITDQAFFMNRDGKYKLTISENGCHSSDSIDFRGITYEGSGVMTAPFFYVASYQWYLNDIPIENATSHTYTATIYGTYKVVIDLCPNCKTTSDKRATFYFNYSPATGITPPNNNKVNIYLYENTLHLSDYNKKDQLMLVDLYGRIVWQEKAQMEINLSGLKKGVYCVRIVDDKGISKHTRMIILQ